MNNSRSGLDHRRGLRSAANGLRLSLLTLLAAASMALAPATASATDDGIHIVARGESLAGIAKEHGVSVQELLSLNSLANPDIIYIGQELVLPGGRAADPYGAPADAGALPAEDGYHIVQRGESLSVIAKQYGIKPADLMRLNGISNPNFIWSGQKLRVTARVAPVSLAREVKPELAHAIYVVQEGDTLSQIAKEYGTTVQDLLYANGLPNASFVYTGQKLRMREPVADKAAMGVAGVPAYGEKWIEINLTNQTLTAWQGDIAVMHTNVSTGKAATPTVVGEFAVRTKIPSQTMSGDDYYLPGVPWVMYFFADYAIHGAYWHMNFGVPMSHGCVNMLIPEAEALYNWAPEGTRVVVHY